MICLEDDCPFQWGFIVRFQPLSSSGVVEAGLHEWCFLLTFLWLLPRGMVACGWILQSFVWNLLSSTWHRTAVGWKPPEVGSWPKQWLRKCMDDSTFFGWFWVKVTSRRVEGWRPVCFGNLAAWHFLSCFFFRTSTGVDIEDDTFPDSLRVLACEESCEGAQCPLKTHCWTSVKKWWLWFCVDFRLLNVWCWSPFGRFFSLKVCWVVGLAWRCGHCSFLFLIVGQRDGKKQGTKRGKECSKRSSYRMWK